METSPSVTEIAKALGQFQYSIGSISKDATNPFFKSKYATLEHIITSTKDALAKNKLTYSQFPDGEGLTTILMHESGEWIKATMTVHMGAKPQEQGSALTYARRYALSAVLGIATEDDDDGNAASQPAKPMFKPKPKEDTKTMAQKDRIMNLLSMLGLPHETKAECEASIKQAVNLDLIPSNYERIGEALGVLLEDIEKNK